MKRTVYLIPTLFVTILIGSCTDERLTLSCKPQNGDTFILGFGRYGVTNDGRFQSKTTMSELFINWDMYNNEDKTLLQYKIDRRTGIYTYTVYDGVKKALVGSQTATCTKLEESPVKF